MIFEFLAVFLSGTLFGMLLGQVLGYLGERQAIKEIEAEKRERNKLKR